MTVLRNTVLFFKFDPEDAFIKSVLIIHSIQFRHSVMSNSLQPHGRQHTRLPCPSPTPGAYSNSCHWVGDAISSSVVPFSSRLQLSQHQGLFQWVSYSHQVAKVLEFQLQVSPSNEYSGLISFRMDWLDLLSVQGTLKSLLQHHSSKASILQCSAFFIVHLHPQLLEKPYLWIDGPLLVK